jgi:SAM-dependent methyltransferase
MTADVERAVEHYRTLAPRYDYYTRWINKVRLRTIAALELRAGQVVLDAGCGTGWCLPHLAERVGPAGRIVAFDPSPDMLALAGRRLGGQGAARIDLIRATGEEVMLPAQPDAILFSYTHDLIRSERALANLWGRRAPARASPPPARSCMRPGSFLRTGTCATRIANTSPTSRASMRRGRAWPSASTTSASRPRASRSTTSPPPRARLGRGPQAGVEDVEAPAGAGPSA